MKCIDHEKTEITSHDGETTQIDNGMLALVNILTNHRIIVRNACEGHHMFVDPTHYEARNHRAELRMIHDEVSLAFVRGLLVDSHFFEADKVLWDIQFDRVPFGQRKNEKRITLAFPAQDIPALVSYFEMKDSLANFHSEPFTL